MKHKLQNQRGETIVEVIVSFMLLLMFTDMFVVSLRYARAMSQKAETLRETAYAFCAGLYPQEKQSPAWQTEKTGQSFTFSAGAGAGAFTVDGVELDQVETQAEVSENGGTPTTETHTFHRYAKEAGEATP